MQILSLSISGVLFCILTYFVMWQVVNKFYEIRHHLAHGIRDISWEDKCERLLNDSEEMWSFNDYSTSKYIVSFDTLGNLPVTDVKTIRSILENIKFSPAWLIIDASPCGACQSFVLKLIFNYPWLISLFTENCL